MKMEASDFLIFLQKAREQEKKERYHRQWCAQLPWMDKESFISFSDYCDQCDGKNIDTRPTEVIIAEIEERQRRLHEKKGSEE